MTTYAWDCQDILKAYDVVFETVFPDKIAESALTPGEVHMLIDGVKDYANSVIMSVLELAEESYKKSYLRLKQRR